MEDDDKDVEMADRNLEEDGLVTKRRGDSKARATYRADMARQRGILLAIMIIPVVLIVILWLVYDSNSDIGDDKSEMDP